jgi:DNA excision repair protein ERCC-1
MRKVGHDFDLRILLILVDVENHDEYLRNLVRVCIHNDFTMLLAWTPQEAANYLVRLKQMENAAPTSIMGQTPQTYREQLVEFMSKVRRVNKSDAVALVSHFGTLKEAILNGTETAELISGWGHTKAVRFRETVTEPFLYNKQYDWPE